MRRFFSGITLKLFLAILLSNIAIAIAMGFAIRYSFEIGFDTYIQNRQDKRLQEIAQVIANEYVDNNGWGQQSRRQWSRLLRNSDAGHRGRDVFRLSLIDINGKLVAGNHLHKNDKNITKPIVVNNKTIGWLVSAAKLPKPINDEIDRQFQQRQTFATWVIVVLSVLLAFK